MRSFFVFIAEKESTWGRYANRYCPPFTDGPKRHLFPKFGSMMFGTAEEFANMMDGMSQAEKKARDEAAGQAEENPAEGVEGEQ